jgi:hypothetical protein
MSDKQHRSFEAVSGERQPGLLADLWRMLKQHKKYWLIPLVAGLFILGLLVYLGGSAAAPFIYTLF